MEGSNIDHYITKFTELAQKAQYHEDDCYDRVSWNYYFFFSIYFPIFPPFTTVPRTLSLRSLLQSLVGLTF